MVVDPSICSGAQATLHHYWVKHGLLHQRDSGPAAAGSDQPAPHTTPAARAGMDDLPLSRAAVEQQSLVAGVPSLPPTQHARPSTAGAASPPRAGMAAAPAELPAESPLASLATAALPSFSPDKPPQTQVLAAAAAADDALTPLPAVAAAGSAPRAARAAQRSSAGSPPAGGLQRSSTAATRWATSLRPPGEQLLPGLPDWDRSRPSSPNTGGGSSRSRSPTRYDGSTPGSPGSRRSSRAASPAGQSPLPGEARHCRQQQHAAPQPQPRQRPPSPQRGVSPPSQRPQQQEAEAAASSGPGPGPLTSMVVKAVSKLQQLQELEEELALPGGAGAGQRLPPGAAPRRRGPWQPSLRRSLEPALGAIQEAASDDDGRGSGSGGSGSRRRARSPMCSAELGRLQHLQEQLQGNMLEVREMGFERVQTHASVGGGKAQRAGMALCHTCGRDARCMFMPHVLATGTALPSKAACLRVCFHSACPTLRNTLQCFRAPCTSSADPAAVGRAAGSVASCRSRQQQQLCRCRDSGLFRGHACRLGCPGRAARGWV